MFHKDAHHFYALLNAVAPSGRVYADTRMDTSWAFRQAYVGCSVIDRLVTYLCTDMTRRARSKKSRMRTVVLLLLGNGQVWANTLKTCNGKH
jgi:hypothetical protein